MRARQDVTSRGQRSAGSQRIPRGSRADAAARRRRTTTKRHRLPIACAASQMSLPGACCKCRIFFFHPLCVGFSLTAWRRAVLDSVRELFTDPCKRNPCSQLCLPCQDAEQPPRAIACNCRIQWWLSNPLGQCQILPVGVLNGHAEHMHLLQIL